MLGLGALLALISGCTLAGSLAMLVIEVRGRLVDPAVPASPPRRRPPATVAAVRRRQMIAVAAVVVGVLGWAVTGLLISAIVLAGLVVVIPWLLAPTRSDKTSIEKTEALQEWARLMVAVTMLGVGLEQALIGSVATAPGPIAAPVTDLAARIQARWPLAAALRAFADDLGSAGGDTVVLTLLTAAENRGPGLAQSLEALADTLADQTKLRREIEARRGESRVTVRYTTLTILFVVAVGCFDRSYDEPYSTPIGLGVLVGCGAAFAGIFTWMRRLITGRPEIRLIADPDAKPAKGGRR